MAVKWQQKMKKDGLEKEKEFELIVDVDKNRLDDEWLGQPKLYFHWGVQFEDAKADLDDAEREFSVAKSEFELVKAEVDLNIRCNPENYKELPNEAVEKGKVTEKMVAAVLLMQPEYTDAQEEFFAFQKSIDIAKHRVGVLQIAVKSLEQRKSSLENLVYLHGQKYFATPQAPEGSREAMEEVEKRMARRKSRKGKRS